MGSSFLRIVDVHKSFVGVQALKGITLSLNSGEIHCLAGENGSGKSTLIKIISGIYSPSKGHIELNHKIYEKISPIEAIKNGIQVIYQDFSVFPNLTVMENLALNRELADRRYFVSWRRMRKIAEDSLSKINFSIDLDADVSSLTVAEKQMVAISRALMFNTKLIIMDEPTTALTKIEVKRLFDIILKLKNQGIAILFVSHKLNEVFEISEYFTILRNGILIESGRTEDLNPRKFSYFMTGREFDPKHFIPEYISDDPILEVKNLNMGNQLSNISFSLKAGEILGITGLLDSGRTDLALSLFGVKTVDSGEIYIKGKSVKIRNIRTAIDNKIGYVPEDRLSEGLFLSQSISDNVIISEIDNLTVSAGIFDRKKIKSEIRKWVKELSIITPDPDNACQTLSGGNQQKVVLAKWLACKPDILILNGPTVGVDIGSKYDIHEILQKLAALGMGIIIISDDLPEVLETCSRILVMKSGEIVESLNAKDADENKILSYMM